MVRPAAPPPEKIRGLLSAARKGGRLCILGHKVRPFAALGSINPQTGSAGKRMEPTGVGA